MTCDSQPPPPPTDGDGAGGRMAPNSRPPCNKKYPVIKFVKINILGLKFFGKTSQKLSTFLCVS
jgi:hypothetical protein